MRASISGSRSATSARSGSDRRTRSTRGAPTVAIPGFQTSRETDAGVRALARWDTLDNSFFPHRGVRMTVDGFYGQRTQRYGDNPDEVSKKLGRIDFYGNAGIPVTDDNFLNIAAARGRAFARRSRARQSVPARRISQPVRPSRQASSRGATSHSGASCLLPPHRPVSVARRERLSRWIARGRQRVAAPAIRCRQAISSRPAACSSPPRRSSGRSISRTDARRAARRASTCSSGGPERLDSAEWVEREPSCRLASVHADEGARDACRSCRSRAAQGAWLYDFDGRRYLDAVSSWWVNLFGHANPRINAALGDAARRARPRDARRLHASPRRRAVRAPGRARAARPRARVLRAPTARRRSRSRSR